MFFFLRSEKPLGTQRKITSLQYRILRTYTVARRNFPNTRKRDSVHKTFKTRVILKSIHSSFLRVSEGKHPQFHYCYIISIVDYQQIKVHRNCIPTENSSVLLKNHFNDFECAALCMCSVLIMLSISSEKLCSSISCTFICLRFLLREMRNLRFSIGITSFIVKNQCEHGRLNVE